MLSQAYSMVFHNERDGSTFSHPSPFRFMASKEGGGEMQVTMKMERLCRRIRKNTDGDGNNKPQLCEAQQLYVELEGSGERNLPRIS